MEELREKLLKKKLVRSPGFVEGCSLDSTKELGERVNFQHKTLRYSQIKEMHWSVQYFNIV